MLNENIKNSIGECVLCWLATASSGGEPNCSPKEVFTFRGESELVIADIASPMSVENIKDNSSVCVSFVHIFKQKGFKIKGQARYVDQKNAIYSELFDLIEPIVGTTFPVRGIILVAVKQIHPIVAPSYYLVEGTTEESQIDSAKRAYNV